MTDNKRFVAEPIRISILNGSLEDEEKKYQNEMSRIGNEANREKAEAERRENEKNREESERQRKSDETERKSRFNEIEMKAQDFFNSVGKIKGMLTTHNEKIDENSNSIQELKAEQVSQNNSLSDLRNNQSTILNDVGNLKVGQSTQDSKIEILEENIKNIDIPIKGIDYFTDDEIQEITTNASNSAKTYTDEKIGDLNTILDEINGEVV